MNNTLNDFTFGNSKAAIALARILSEEGNHKCKKFVATNWQKYTTVYNEIWWSKITRAHKHFLINLLTEHTIASINRNVKSPEKVKSYLCNIICARQSHANKVYTLCAKEEQREAQRNKMRLLEYKSTDPKIPENTP